MRHDENDIAEAIRAILEVHASSPGTLLPALHAVQDALGYIPSEAVAMLADAFNLSRAEVHGVISFYHDFRTAPPAKHIVRICCAEACQSMGSDRLLAHAEQGRDAEVSVERVYCLGHCAASPCVLIDDAPHARMTPGRLNTLIGALKEGM